MAFTVMSGASARARQRVSMMTPALDVQYATYLGQASNPPRDAKLTMRPWPLARSKGAARCAQKNCDFRFESIIVSHWSSVVSASGVEKNAAAELMRISSREKRLSMALKKVSISCGRLKSAENENASPPPRAI